MQSTEQYAVAKEAERQLLASILIGRDNIEDIKRVITPDDFMDARFHDNRHARIYSAMCNCSDPHQVNVALELNRTGKLQQGDCAYLCELVGNDDDWTEWPAYMKAVKEYSTQRKVEYHTRKGNFKRVNELTRQNIFDEGIAL